MEKTIDVAIIGTGTAALNAASEVRRVTGNFIIVSNGIYGTTCVLAGCMPSKVLIQGSIFAQQCKLMQSYGITGTEKLHTSIPALLKHIRDMREHFLITTLKSTDRFKDHIVEGDVYFLAPAVIQVGNDVYRAKRIVLASGSTPIIPDGFTGMDKHVLTSDTLFEQDDLPATLSVLALSVLGLEMAQAFARLGIDVSAIHRKAFVGGLSDPEVNDYAVRALRRDMNIRLNASPATASIENNKIILHAEPPVQADKLFLAVSRKANICHMGLEELGIIECDAPVCDFNPHTMQVRDLPLFIAGDVKSGRSILNEASDEGRIAGYNAARDRVTYFTRRTPLQITYTDPLIAIAGQPWKELNADDVVTGTGTFDNQGRAKIIGMPSGIIRLYAHKDSGQLLGAELFAPHGDHLAHMLAWLIDRRVTIFEALELPFYHPTLEEAIRTALHDAAGKLPYHKPLHGYAH